MVKKTHTTMQAKESAFTGNKRYSPIRLLGKGGMGAVYEVEDTLSGAHLALKVMLNQEPQQLLRFKQEFRMVAELHHPNLVRLFDLGVEANQWFFTMEFVRGQSLLTALNYRDNQEQKTREPEPATLAPDSEEITSGAVEVKEEAGAACDVQQLIGLMAQVLDGLEHLHQRGIIHRDLKPGNIILGDDGVVRLLDFGLASHTQGASIDNAGKLVGTLAYVSPEQCQGQPASAASDLYALGCMMFQFLTGKLPFIGSAEQLIQTKLTQLPPRVERSVVGVPKELAQVCYRLLSKIPTERPSIEEVRAALGVKRLTPSSSLSKKSSLEQSFVGRQRERDILEERLRRASEGELSLALVSGKSGIGKSTLAGVVARSAQSLGFLCVQGRCYERERLPFVALDRAMDSLILLLSRWPESRLEPIYEALSDVAPIFPAAATLLPKRRPKTLSTRDADLLERSRRAFEGFCSLLLYCQSIAPLLLILDDLQWADAESIELLQALLSRKKAKILLLGLYRPEGLEGESPLRRLFPYAQENGQEIIALSGLSPTESKSLIEASAKEALDPETIALLAGQVEGNPFLALQMALYLAKVPQTKHNARLQSEGKDAWLRSSLGALSPRAEKVLSLAATSGGDILRLVLYQASGLSIEDFDLALGELMSARMCKALPSKERAEGAPLECLDLYHDRIREAAYERLEPVRRQELHQALALSLEDPPQGISRDAEALLRHWTEAKDAAKRYTFTLEAAEQAAAKLAFRRAAQLFQQALEDPAAQEEPLQIAARWERVGSLSEYSGRLKEASEAYQRALDYWEQSADSKERTIALLRLRGRVGEALMARGQLNQGRQVYTDALSLLGLPLGRPLPRQIITLVWLRILLFFGTILPRGTKKTTDFEEEQLRFFSAMLRAMMPLSPLIAIEAGMRCDLLGIKADDKQVLLRSMANQAAIPVLLETFSPEKIERAKRSLQEAEEMTKRHQIPFGLEVVKLNRSLLLTATDLESARRESEAAQEGLARGGMAEFYDSALARVYYGKILFMQGDNETLLRVASEDIERETPNFNNEILALSYKVWLYTNLGRFTDAEEVNTQIQHRMADVPPSFLMLFSTKVSAILRSWQGRPQDGLNAMLSLEQAIRPMGLFTSQYIRSHWLEGALLASMVLYKRGELSDPMRKRAISWAKELSRIGVLDFSCVGRAAFALLTYQRAENPARRMIEKALVLSDKNTAPHRRFICIQVARELGAMPPSLEEEATTLLKTKGLVLPLGWAN
jgi:serine/threonine protein kinase